MKPCPICKRYPSNISSLSTNKVVIGRAELSASLNTLYAIAKENNLPILQTVADTLRQFTHDEKNTILINTNRRII